MSDTTFETLLTGQLRDYAEAGVRPIDRHAIAERTIAVGRRRGLAERLHDLSPLGTRVGPRAAVLWLALLLLVLAAAAAAVAIGSRQIDRHGPLAGGWVVTGKMQFQRDWAASAALRDGRVLVVGGIGQDFNQVRGEVFDPAAGTFAPTAGNMSLPRISPTATTLRDGRVLIAGGTREAPDGSGSYVATATAELFDPATGRFAPTGSMAHARQQHVATLLADGRVLVIGGAPSPGANGSGSSVGLASAEIYDPVTGAWSEVAPMPQERTVHAGVVQDSPAGPTATLLEDGTVLVAGGSSAAGPLASATLFDPTTGRWSETGSMATSRYDASATRLPDGRVLIVGGNAAAPDSPRPGVALASAEVYDPRTGRFSATGSLTTERSGHSATLLPNGLVLIAGGGNAFGRPLTAELYDPDAGTFSVASAAAGEHGGLAALLPDGRVLAADGQPELFDPTMGAPIVPAVPSATTAGGASVSPTKTVEPAPRTAFTATGSPLEDRNSHTATKLVDGRVLIVGGEAVADGRVLATAEIYDPTTGSFSPTGSLSEPRTGQSALRLRDGRVLVTGGYTTGSVPRTNIEIFDPATGRFSASNPFDLAGLDPSTIVGPARPVLLADGRIIVFGPEVKTAAGDGADTLVQELDPSATTAVRRPDLTGCDPEDAQPLVDGRILVLCSEPSGISPRIYDPSTGQSSTLRSVPTGGGSSGPDRAIVLDDGRVLLVDVGPPSGLLLFDPATGASTETGTPRGADQSAIWGSASTRLPDGRIFIASESQDSVWDPTTGVNTQLRSVSPVRPRHTATLLDDGRVLIVGPTEWPADRTLPRPPGAELFDPAALP